MPKETNYLDITLLGKEYRVACPSEERDALLAAVTFVDGKMHEIAEKTRSNVSERIAVMAALNIAHEFLAQNHSSDDIQLSAHRSETGVDIDAAKRRILFMEAQLDAILSPQDKLI